MRQCLNFALNVKITDLFCVPWEPSLHHPRSLEMKPSWFSQASSKRKVLFFTLEPVFAVRRIGKWSEVILGNASILERGNSSSHSVETRNRSSLANVGFACKLDHVKDWLDKGRSIKASSLISSMNKAVALMLQSFSLRSSCLLVQLKSPQMIYLPTQWSLSCDNFAKNSSLPSQETGP